MPQKRKRGGGVSPVQRVQARTAKRARRARIPERLNPRGKEKERVPAVAVTAAVAAAATTDAEARNTAEAEILTPKMAKRRTQEAQVQAEQMIDH